MIHGQNAYFILLNSAIKGIRFFIAVMYKSIKIYMSNTMLPKYVHIFLNKKFTI